MWMADGRFGKVIMSGMLLARHADGGKRGAVNVVYDCM